ncbi:glycoside hydrolase family 76 protein [Xylariaceae sp. FL0804]|nr:glycoside hydrolase family 76 protein [Xylariaceae sp. FL0804]
MRCSCRNAALSVASLLITACSAQAGYNLDLQSVDSIKSVTKQMTGDLLSFYTGDEPGQTPGLLPSPYYWWEAGAMMGTLIDYWYYTGDDTYNNITQEGLLFQVGPYNDYMPPNQTLTEGNDDQGFWGMAVMTAAEYNFQNPPEDQPQWLALAQAVFNTQAARWDMAHCDGGLRWQIFTWNNGYNYKNSISQACLFNIASRLAVYTGNTTYSDWAVKIWDWMTQVKLMDETYRIYDGAHIEDNCQSVTPYEFSYNVGAFLLGAAAMVQYTNQTNDASGNAMWHDRVDGILNSTEEIFFFGNDTADKVMIEIACEPVNLCDTDELSFKAYLSRWMAASTKWAPWTYTRIKTLLANSATAAAKQCVGGSNGRMCGLKWANNSGHWDGTTGVGQQMAAIEVVLGNMIRQAEMPVTNSTGGTSVGDPSAGGSDANRVNPVERQNGPIDNGDRAGAIILTLVFLGTTAVALVFMCADETKSASDNWDNLRSGRSLKAVGAAVLNRGGKSSMGAAEKKTKGNVAGDRSSSEGSKSGEVGPEVTTYARHSEILRSPPPAAVAAAPTPAERKRLSRSAAKSPPPPLAGGIHAPAGTPSRGPSDAPNGRHSTGPELSSRSSVLKKQKKQRPMST